MVKSVRPSIIISAVATETTFASGARAETRQATFPLSSTKTFEKLLLNLWVFVAFQSWVSITLYGAKLGSPKECRETWVEPVVPAAVRANDLEAVHQLAQVAAFNCL